MVVVELLAERGRGRVIRRESRRDGEVEREGKGRRSGERKRR